MHGAWGVEKRLLCSRREIVTFSIFFSLLGQRDATSALVRLHDSGRVSEHNNPC